MSVRVYVPRPGRSVRPPDLEPAEREAVRAGAPPGRPRRGRGARHDLPLLIVLALGLAFVIKTLLVQAFYIPSTSMLPTLAVGDRVLVEKVAYRLRGPERGEVIVFRRPGAESGGGSLGGALRQFLEGLGLVQPDADIDLIKRIVGLPGETVEIRQGTVFVDNRALDEPYARLDRSDYGPRVVAEGRYFVLGDNRGSSDDSRFALGMVGREDIVGRAFVVLWPPARIDVALDRDYPMVGERG